ncbi:hypothetical protein N665_0042s0024 [Sinapis alba]|nr:hypothetical protein N665_0042s0024 [Sinapis alba]
MEHREVMQSEKSGENSRQESKLEDRKGNQQNTFTEGFRSGSWLKAVQGKKILTKYDMDIQMRDGVGSVKGDFLKAPHIAKVHAIVNMIWALSDKAQMIDVYEINSTTMKFKVSSPVTRNRIIRRAMWNIAEIHVVMAKWNVPMDMFTWKGLSFVSSPVGTPVRLHPETEQSVNLKVAKIFVKVDLSKEMPKSMNFTFQGKKTLGSKLVGSAVRAEANETVGTGLIKTGGKKWEEISLGKACRTPSKQLEYGQVSKMSKSRFSVISSEEEEGKIMETHEGVNVINKEEEEEEDDIEEKKEEELEESELKSEEDKIYMRQYLPRGSKNKHKFLNWLRSQSFQFGSLIETRVKEGKAAGIVDSVFQHWSFDSFMANYEHNNLDRIWVIWGPSVRMTPEIFCSFVYALNTMEERRILWEDLRNHKDSAMLRNKQWMVFGDFNEILDGREHSGNDINPYISADMRDFQEAASYCSLLDMCSHGPDFTWCNKKEEGLICKRLDRVLINDVALHKLRNNYSVFEAGGCSDHLRCMIHLESEGQKKRRPYKFTNVIATMEEFLPTVEGYWKKTKKLFHSTSAMFRLGKKLKGLKPSLRTLSKEKLGQLPKETKEAYLRLCEKQRETLQCPTPSAIKAERKALEKWQKLADLEEEFYKQKSKLHWMEVGDRNNRFFSQCCKNQRSKRCD